MRVISTTENFLVDGVQLPIGIVVEVSKELAPRLLSLPGVIEDDPELLGSEDLTSESAAPTPTATHSTEE